jgi:hypothetical protein
MINEYLYKLHYYCIYSKLNIHPKFHLTLSKILEIKQFIYALFSIIYY